MGHKTFREEDYDFMRWFLSRSPDPVHKPVFNAEQKAQCEVVSRRYASQHPNRSDPHAFNRMMHYLHMGFEDLRFWLKEYKLA